MHAQCKELRRQAPRWLKQGLLCAAPLVAARGIVAGAASATYELTCFTVEVLRAHGAAFPSTRISMHVDDVSQTARGPDVPTAVRSIVASSAWLADEFRQLGLPLALKKGMLLASSTEAFAGCQQGDAVSGRHGLDFHSAPWI